MDFNFDLIHKYGLEFLLDNVYGFYLPLLITIFVSLKYNSIKGMFKNLEMFLIFAVSTFSCIYFSEVKVLTGEMTIQGALMYYESEALYGQNIYPALYLFWFGLIKKDYNFNLAIAWTGSFITLWLSDVYFAVFTKGESIFSSNIGGAGLFDGLLIEPIFSTFIIFLIISSIKILKKKEEKC